MRVDSSAGASTEGGASRSTRRPRAGALTAVGLIGLILGATALTPASATAQSTVPVIPTLDCVSYDPTHDRVTANFGYINANDAAVEIAIGASNFFSPPPSFRGQPTSFQPGVTKNAFQATFDLFTISSITWNLNGKSVSASNNEARYCDQSADLSVDQTSSPETPLVGEQLTYTLTAKSEGPLTATGVEITDQIGAGADLESVTPSQGSCAGTDPVVCQLGTINRGGTATVDLTVTPTRPGGLNNTASVSGEQADLSADNNVSKSLVTVFSPPSAQTGAASERTHKGAQLTGLVDPNGSTTTYRFDYGLDETYGSTTTEVGAGAADEGSLVDAELTGLEPGTTYHYRLVATNEHGTSEGSDRTFSTREPAPAGLKLGPNPGSVKPGLPFSLYGKLKDSQGSPLEGQAVTLYRRLAGDDQFTPIRSKPSSDSGAIAFKGLQLRTAASFQLRFSGDPASGVRAARSPIRRVAVRP